MIIGCTGMVVLGCNGPSWQVHRQRQNIISSCVADTQDTLSSALRKSIRTKSTFNYGHWGCQFLVGFTPMMVLDSRCRFETSSQGVREKARVFETLNFFG